MPVRLRTYRHLIAQAVRSLRVNRFMALASVGTVFISLLVFGIFVAAIVNLTNMSAAVGSRFQVRVFLQDGLSSDEVQSIGRRVGEIEGVKRLDFVPRNEALERLRVELKDRENLLDVVYGNPLPDSYELYTAPDPSLVRRVAREIKALKGVEEVNYPSEFLDKLFAVIRTFWVLAGLALGFLMLAVVFIVVNTIRLTVFARRKEIEIMSLVGATDWFVRWPFVFEGMILGVLGALLASSVLYGSYGVIMPRLSEAVPFLPLVADRQAILPLCAWLLVLGAFMGVIGSAVSVKKFVHSGSLTSL